MYKVPNTGSLIVTLGFEEAAEAIRGTRTVMYRRGVWNQYHPLSTEQAITNIMRSGYGADVRKNDCGEFFVTIPCDSDMW